MAQNETWLNHDMMNAVKVQYLDGNVFSMDNAGNLIGVLLTKGGVDYSGGGTVSANVIRADGATVAVSGALSGNAATVVLPQAAYAVPGVLSIIIKLTVSGEVTTIAAVVANVYQSSTDSTVDPGTIIPSIETLIAAIDAAVASIPADYSSLWTSLAPAFNSSASYITGQYVTYNGAVYRFTKNHSGSWSSSDVTAVNIGGDFGTFKSNLLKPLYVIQKVSNVQQFKISAVRASRPGVYYTYTVTTLLHDTFNGISSVENGTNYEMYTFTYEHGCNNTGTATNAYKFDDTIVSDEITGYGALVVDRSDFKIKIINTASLNENHRVLAVFFRNGNELKKSFTAFGTNGALFGQRYAEDFNRFYMQNGSGSPVGALTVSYNSDTRVYTVTRNNSTFFVYGFTDWNTNRIGIGAEGISGLDYPMPASFSSSTGISNFAAIVADRFDNTTSTWDIVSQETFDINKDKYIVLGFIYRDKTNVVFFNGMAKDLFTNYVASDPGTEVQPISGDLYKAFKKVGVIGDSLSVGYMYNKTAGVATTRMLPYSWVKNVMKTTGVPWLNLGTSGQGTLTWYSNGTYGKVQAEASGNKCQAYIIGLGQNDQNSSSSGYAPLGTPEDITDSYTATVSTYYGGYSRIIALLKHINPDCIIFCLTNPMSGGNRAAYNNAVKYICDTYYASDGKVILADLAGEFGYLINNGYLLNDYNAITGGHYSAAGYSRIASIIQQVISNAMEKAVLSIWDVAFIPYDTGDPTPNTMTE